MHGLKKTHSGKNWPCEEKPFVLWGIQESENCCALYLLGAGGGGGGGDKRGNKLVSIQLSKPGTISQLYVLKINVEAHFVCYIPPSPFL